MSKESEIVESRVSIMLIEIGAPANIQGYKFLKEAVGMVVEDASLINNVTKKLYPMIAEKENVSSSVVERSIRHCVDCAISRKNTRGINSVFKCDVYDPYYKPSNSELIALLAEKIVSERAEKHLNDGEGA